MRWRKDTARASGWAGTPGTPVRLARQKPNCTFPATGVGCFRVGWRRARLEGAAVVLPGPGSCPSPVLGVGAQEPWFVALSPVVPGSISGLGCLELAPPFPSSTARAAARPSWGLSPPCCPSQALNGSGQALQVLFGVAPSPASISGAHPGCCVVLGYPAALLQPPLAGLPVSSLKWKGRGF